MWFVESATRKHDVYKDGTLTWIYIDPKAYKFYPGIPGYTAVNDIITNFIKMVNMAVVGIITRRL